MERFFSEKNLLSDVSEIKQNKSRWHICAIQQMHQSFPSQVQEIQIYKKNYARLQSLPKFLAF